MYLGITVFTALVYTILGSNTLILIFLLFIEVKYKLKQALIAHKI